MNYKVFPCNGFYLDLRELQELFTFLCVMVLSPDLGGFVIATCWSVRRGGSLRTSVALVMHSAPHLSFAPGTLATWPPGLPTLFPSSGRLLGFSCLHFGLDLFSGQYAVAVLEFTSIVSHVLGLFYAAREPISKNAPPTTTYILSIS